jgi:phage gp16-like protein
MPRRAEKNGGADDRLRRAELAAIHVGKKQLKLDDEAYRALLLRLCGVSSSRDLTGAGRRLVIDAMRALGFQRSKPAPAPPPRSLGDEPQSKFIWHLWCELDRFGALRDPSERALNKFVRRVAKVDAVRWLDGPGASLVIEGLKGWLARIRRPVEERGCRE